MSYMLSVAQKPFFADNGYLIGLPPIYSRQEMQRLNQDLPELLKLLQPGETAKDIRECAGSVHNVQEKLVEYCHIAQASHVGDRGAAAMASGTSRVRCAAMPVALP